MGAGIQLFDESGNMIMDVSDSLTRILGKIVIPKDAGSVSGEIVDDNLLLGTPFFYTTGGVGQKISIKTWQNAYQGFTADANGVPYPKFIMQAWRCDVIFQGNKLIYNAPLVHPTYLIPTQPLTIVYGVF